MQHRIPVAQLGPQAKHMASAVEACVHCGFCLPTCPTYIAMGEEMDSPRGRIILMKEVLEGVVELEEAMPYIDHCLGCVACVTACPSGVQYGELLTPFRAYVNDKRKRDLAGRIMGDLLIGILPYPKRFAALAFVGRFIHPFKRFLPRRLRTPLELLPRTLKHSKPLPEHSPARGKRRARVALLSGCAQQVLAPNINWATLRVLSANGVEVIVPKGQSCCGALAMHVGKSERARDTARANLAAFDREVDAIVTTAAGCGSGMREYGLLFKGESDEGAARTIARKVCDVSKFLSDLGFRTVPEIPDAVKVVYHDACHLAHAQGERSAPRALLESTGNLTLLEPPEWEICCGSAGTYNVDQPEIAAQLGKRKVKNLLSTGAQAIATGNIGCITQIQSHLCQINRSIPVFHTMEILDRAYRKEPLISPKD